MFSPSRFARLAAAEWAENRRGWAWFFGVVVILHFVLVLVLQSGEKGYGAFDLDGQSGMFFGGLFLTAPVFAARYFQAMARPGPALLALMRPASALEKWLLALLVVGVAYPLAYHLVFYVVDVPAVLVAQQRAAAGLAELNAQISADINSNHDYKWELSQLAPENFRLFTLVRADVQPGGLVMIGLMLAAVQGFALTGSLLFKRAPFLKTLLAAFLVLLACMLASSVFDSDPDTFFEYWHRIADDDIWMTAAQRVVFPVAWIAIPALTWLAAFLALRERELA